MSTYSINLRHSVSKVAKVVYIILIHITNHAKYIAGAGRQFISTSAEDFYLTITQDEDDEGNQNGLIALSGCVGTWDNRCLSQTKFTNKWQRRGIGIGGHT